MFIFLTSAVTHQGVNVVFFRFIVHKFLSFSLGSMDCSKFSDDDVGLFVDLESIRELHDETRFCYLVSAHHEVCIISLKKWLSSSSRNKASFSGLVVVAA